MKSKLALIALTALLTIPLVTTQMARAQPATLCLDDHGNNVQDISPIPVNTHVTCTASLDNPKVTQLECMVMDSRGHTVLDKIFNGKTGTFDFTTTFGGTWSVWCTWFGKGGIELHKEVANLHVSFSVVPESPIGTAALVGSSIAALGGFMALRHHSRPKL